MARSDQTREPGRPFALGLAVALIADTIGWTALVAAYVVDAIRDRRRGIGVDPLEDIGAVILFPSLVSALAVAMAVVAIRYRGRWGWVTCLPYVIVFGLLAPVGFAFAFAPGGIHHSTLAGGVLALLGSLNVLVTVLAAAQAVADAVGGAAPDRPRPGAQGGRDDPDHLPAPGRAGARR